MCTSEKSSVSSVSLDLDRGRKSLGFENPMEFGHGVDTVSVLCTDRINFFL